VKVEGERLYRKARRGEQIETPVRQIEISRLELTDFDQAKQRAALEVDCSSGTYVRQLVIDLGELCGCGAYCAELERTAIGPFSLTQADPQRLIDSSQALSFLPERAISTEECARVQNGVAVTANGSDPQAKLVRLTAAGKLIAVAQRQGEQLKPVTVVGASA
jgi:tRNA pseudouridine55 synthase